MHWVWINQKKSNEIWVCGIYALGNLDENGNRTTTLPPPPPFRSLLTDTVETLLESIATRLLQVCYKL